MKKSLLNVVALFIGITSVYANDAVFVFQGDTITPETGYTIPCMGYQDTLVVKIDRNIFNPSQINHWSASGELKIKEDTTNGLDSVHIYSTGPARGGITISYDHGSCSGYSQEFFINKTFHPDSFNIKIEGPKCITDTQRVVYSVKPILTKNLGANIGIDSYIWNVLETPRPYFVDSILYVSGDTSSVTFRVSHVDPDHLPEIKVRIGACNEGRELILIPGNSTPKPEMIDTMYVPVGSEPFKVGVIKSDSSIQYAWSCSPASFTIEPFGKGDSAIVKISNSALNADCNIYVSATYKDIQCNYSMDTMIVKRNWGSDVSFDSTKISGTCYTIAKGGKIDYYPFALKGAGLPISSEFEWTLPYGWNFKNDEVSNAQEIEIYPTSSALLVDTLKVRPRDSHDPAQPLSYTVYIKPDTIPSVRIKQDSCLAYNYEGGVYIDTTGLHMPEGVWFEWSAPYAEILNTQGTDTLRFIPSTQTNIVSVTAKGINSCDAASTEHNLIFEPQKPDSIIWIDSACVSFNMPDTLRFTVANALPGQKYEWTKPTGWRWGDTISDPKDLAVTIELISNGEAKIDTIYAKGVNENNSNCSFSDSVVFYITTDSLPAHIQYYGKQGTRTRYGIEYGWDIWEEGDPDPLYYPEEVCWYLFNNGIPYNEAILNGRYSETVEFARTFGDIINSTQYTLVVDVKFDNGCKTRVQYGATLNLDTLDMQRSAPLMRRTVETTIIPKLIVKPNPTPNAAIINLTNSHLETADLYVYNIGGQLIKSINNFHIDSELDVSMLPVGKYIVVLKDGEDEYVQHFLKSR